MGVHCIVAWSKLSSRIIKEVKAEIPDVAIEFTPAIGDLMAKSLGLSRADGSTDEWDVQCFKHTMEKGVMYSVRFGKGHSNVITITTDEVVELNSEAHDIVIKTNDRIQKQIHSGDSDAIDRRTVKLRLKGPVYSSKNSDLVMRIGSVEIGGKVRDTLIDLEYKPCEMISGLLAEVKVPYSKEKIYCAQIFREFFDLIIAAIPLEPAVRVKSDIALTSLYFVKLLDMYEDVVTLPYSERHWAANIMLCFKELQLM